MKSPVLELESVAIGFKLNQGWRGFFKKTTQWALQDISFSIYPGETLGIIGRNGVGKTSLLRTLAGILAPDRGRVINHGVSVNMLGLSTGFIPQLSGYDNIIINGVLMGLSKSTILSIMPNIISFSELAEHIHKPVSTYSSGMSTRLGFSIALYNHADILLIDETLSVGDAVFKKKSSHALQEIITSNRTVVLTSHSASTIRTLCNRVVWIENGVVKMIGIPDDVLKEYESYLEKAS